MKFGFVGIQMDEAKVKELLHKGSEIEAVFCYCSRDIGSLLEVDELYFVISRTAMCSTQLQETVYAAFPVTEHLVRWALLLEETKIPLGFAILNCLSTTQHLNSE